MIIFILSILIAASAPISSGASAQPDSTELDSSGNRRASFMLLPIIFSSPDTRLGLGVLPQVVFRTSTSSNPSTVRMDTYYTLNRQYHVLLRPRFWLDNNALKLSGKFSFKKWPTSFYGIGNDTPQENQEKFTETLYESSVEGIKHVADGFFAGLNYSMRHSKIDPESETGPLASGTLVTGSGTSFTSAVGAVFRLDTRDNHFFPSRGSYHTVELVRSGELLGSDFGFTRFTVDLRRYLPIKRSHVLALQGMVSLSEGDVPFRMLSSVGSDIRGYSSVRYIDRHMAGFQMGYRVVPVAWRLGLTFFAGAGEVFGSFEDIQFDNIKYNVGIGIRYQFSRSEKINIRMDYGVGRDSSGDYLDLTEAF